MKDSTINRIAWGTVLFIIFSAVFFVGLVAWGFIEIIQWITSM